MKFDIRANVAPVDDDIFGATTIDICHLQRYRLIKSRETILATVVEYLRCRAAAAQRGNAAIVRWVDTRLEAACSPAAPHAAVARAVCNDPEAYGAPPLAQSLARRRRRA